MYQGSDARLKEIGDSFFRLLMSLESTQVEYDLGSEDVIARHSSVEGAGLRIGQRTYRTVVLPPLIETLDSRTWELLNDYVANGGVVLACKSIPSIVVIRRDGVKAANDATPVLFNPRWQRLEVSEVPRVLRERSAGAGFQITRTPGDAGTLFHMRRQLDDGELLLLVNTSITTNSTGKITSSRLGIEKWDLETGQTVAYPFQQERGVQAEFDLAPCGSLLLFLSNTSRPASAPTAHVTSRLAASGAPEIRALDPNVLVLDYVDVTAGGETRTNVYFYQGNQFAFQKNGMDRDPWDSAVQFKDELIHNTFPAGSGLKATYRFDVAQRVPSSLSIVIERPDLYKITCNGKVVHASPGEWWLDRAFGRIDLTGLACVGANEVTLGASPFTVYHELEPAYLLGEFGVQARERGFVIVPGTPLEFGQWKNQGYPFYSGAVRYRESFELKNRSAGEVAVALPSWRGSVAQVMVNGQLAGYITHAPWRCAVTSFLQPNRNVIDVLVIGTLKNTLGPHHGQPSLGTAWPGMFQKGPSTGPPAGAEYDTVGYGLMKPFELEQVILQ
jgi:hypothetical protein